MEYLTDGKRHLICRPYSVKNLHKMAADLNLKRCWYHGGTYPHYDVPKMRVLEITAKARTISSRQLLQIIKDAGYGQQKPLF